MGQENGHCHGYPALGSLRWEAEVVKWKIWQLVSERADLTVSYATEVWDRFCFTKLLARTHVLFYLEKTCLNVAVWKDNQKWFSVWWWFKTRWKFWAQSQNSVNVSNLFFIGNPFQLFEYVAIDMYLLIAFHD